VGRNRAGCERDERNQSGGSGDGEPVHGRYPKQLTLDEAAESPDRGKRNRQPGGHHTRRIAQD